MFIRDVVFSLVLEVFYSRIIRVPLRTVLMVCCTYEYIPWYELNCDRLDDCTMVSPVRQPWEILAIWAHPPNARTTMPGCLCDKRIYGRQPFGTVVYSSMLQLHGVLPCRDRVVGHYRTIRHSIVP